jgi:NitT/TauT family transport system substrate-binding protein
MLLVGGIAVSACGAQPASEAGGAAPEKTIKVAYNVWVGSAGVYVADASDYFEEEGVDVELVQFASPTEAAQAVLAGQVDAAVTTLDTLVMLKGKESADNPLQMVHAIDVSNGADGIVASEDIQEIADLKGKKVAVTIGAVNHFLLSYALQAEGLSDADVELVNMAPELTGSTFMTGQVDAAVTWEPFLTEAQSNGGTLLYSTADAPGVVVDVLMTSKTFAEGNADALKGMVAAIDRGVEDFKAEKDGTDDIVAGAIGSKPEEVRDIAFGLELFTSLEAKRLMVDDIAALEATLAEMSDFFLEQELIENGIDPKTVVNPFLFQE